ncbi:MAG: UDP-N-acetylmuramoyl-tripeptide--D-alanyl-D-alanine ligase [Luteitalea sp.]|nr:UDP-N-acetylmuramoyl-tripeptide--D-alanyl-D-alanine ligase [Luteitalea sp.]
MWWSSPVRATRRRRRLVTASCRSTTRWWRAWRSRGDAKPRRYEAVSVPPVSVVAAEAATVCGGRLAAGRAKQPIGRVSIDSRTLRRGELFIAIRGARFDGHDFVAAALAAGAMGAIVDAAHRAPAVGADQVVIVVDDTTRALQRIASHVRRQSGARVVAITGSVGKTTTKDVTAALLAMRYRTFRNEGNLNNHIGLPLSLLELTSRPDVAVVELGMSAPGEIRRLVEISEPNVRVWTNVGPAHLEFFDSVDAIADAKAEICEQADASTELVANADDARVMARIGGFPGHTITFGLDQPAHVQATDIEDGGLRGMRANVDVGGRRASIETPLIGRGNLANVLAAIAVADAFAVPLADVTERVRTLTPAAHRGEVFTNWSGVTVVDDAYNSSPLALERALQTLGAEPRAVRRVAVLGEMFELGEASETLHRAAGRVVVECGIARLVTVGGAAARALGEAAIEAGLPPTAVTHTATSDEAGHLVATLVAPGDVVLVKGSRGVRLERVVERLKGSRGAG